MKRFNRIIQRNLIQIFLLGLILFTSACGGKPNQTATLPTAEGGSSTPVIELNTPGNPTLDNLSTFPTGQESTGHATITFSDNEYMQPKWQPLIDQFNTANPNIKVVFVPIVKARVEGMQPDDIKERATVADTTVVYGITSSNAPYLRDLQPLIDVDQSYQESDFWPGAAAGCSDPIGRKLGLPLELSLDLIYYDREAFRKAGIAEPHPSWNLDEFKSSVNQLAGASSGQSIPFSDGPYTSILETIIHSNLNQNEGQLNAANLERDIQWYTDWVKQGVIYPISPEDYSDTDNKIYRAWQAPFLSANPPFMWIGNLKSSHPTASIDLGSVSPETDPTKNLAILQYSAAPIPMGTQNTASNGSPSIPFNCAVISAGSQNIQASWKWINFLTNFWYGKDDTLLSNHVIAPARKSVAEFQGYWNALPQSVIQSVKAGLEQSFNSFGTYHDEIQVIYKALEQVFEGNDTLHNALLQAQSEIQDLPPKQIESIPAFSVPLIDGNSSTTDGIKEVSFFANTYAPDELAALRTLIEQFNQEYTGKIEVNLVVQFPEEGQGYYQKLARNADCFISQTDPMNAFASGSILSLNPWIDSDTKLKQDLDTGLLTNSMWQGNLMSLPIVSQPPVLVYNMDLLQQQGITIPTPDWDLAAFSNFISSLTNLSNDHTVFASIQAGEVGSFNIEELLLLNRGIQWLDVSGSLPRAKFTSPEAIAGLHWFAELTNSDLFFNLSGSSENWWSEISSVMGNGKIATWGAIAGSETGQLFAPGTKPSYPIGVLPFPKLPNNVGISQAILSRGFYISSSSENQEACLAFGKEIVSTPNVLHGVPSRVSIANSADWTNMLGSNLAVLYRTSSSQVRIRDLNGIHPYLVFPLDTWWAGAIMAVQNGSQPEPTAQTAQQKADTYSSCLQITTLNSTDPAKLQEQVTFCAKQADPDWQ